VEKDQISSNIPKIYTHKREKLKISTYKMWPGKAGEFFGDF